MAKIRSVFQRWMRGGVEEHGRPEVPVEPAVHENVRFEPVDVNARRVFYTAIGVVVGTLLAIVLVLPVFRILENYRSRHSQILPSAAGQVQVPPEPRLQQEPRRDLAGFRTYEDKRLHSYGWVDRSRGVVSIPIEQAMQLTLQRGITEKKAPPGNVYFNPHEGARQTGFDEREGPVPK